LRVEICDCCEPFFVRLTRVDDGSELALDISALRSSNDLARSSRQGEARASLVRRR